MVKIDPMERSEIRNAIVFAGPALIEMSLNEFQEARQRIRNDGEVERDARKEY